MDGAIAGAVWSDRGVYEIRPTADPMRVRVLDLGRAALPGCVALREGAEGEQPAVGDPALRGEPEQITRVLVGFTETGAAQVGGQNQVFAFASAAIESANTAYDNSLMTVGDDGAVRRIGCRFERDDARPLDPPIGIGERHRCAQGAPERDGAGVQQVAVHGVRGAQQPQDRRGIADRDPPVRRRDRRDDQVRAGQPEHGLIGRETGRYAAGPSHRVAPEPVGWGEPFNGLCREGRTHKTNRGHKRRNSETKHAASSGPGFRHRCARTQKARGVPRARPLSPAERAILQADP